MGLSNRLRSQDAACCHTLYRRPGRTRALHTTPRALSTSSELAVSRHCMQVSRPRGAARCSFRRRHSSDAQRNLCRPSGGEAVVHSTDACRVLSASSRTPIDAIRPAGCGAPTVHSGSLLSHRRSAFAQAAALAARIAARLPAPVQLVRGSGGGRHWVHGAKNMAFVGPAPAHMHALRRSDVRA